MKRSGSSESGGDISKFSLDIHFWLRRSANGDSGRGGSLCSKASVINKITTVSKGNQSYNSSYFLYKIVHDIYENLHIFSLYKT